MAKTLSQPTNFRVVVEPRSLGNLGIIRTSDSFLYPTAEGRAKAYEERCQDIAEQIKRHVDEVGYITIESDREAVCEHCGADWTEESADYNGGCCSKDEEAHEAALAESQP